MKRRYQIAKDIFREYKVPLSQVIMLFAELYPESFIKQMITKFEVVVKEIPYNELMVVGNAATAGKGGKYERIAVEGEKRLAMREFLTYFMKKREEIGRKIEEMKRVERPEME